MLSRSAHYFSGLVPGNYREQLLDYLAYRAPVKTGGVKIGQEAASGTSNKIDASLDDPDKLDKQNFSNGMKLLNDEKAK